MTLGAPPQFMPSGLVFERERYERRLELVRDHDFYLLSSSDAEWLTGVPRIAAWTEYDPAVSEALTACFIGERGPLFSYCHSEWHLESGQAMRSWQVEPCTTGSDPHAHLRRMAEIAGWRRAGPILVPGSTPTGNTKLLREAFPDRPVVCADVVLGPLRARKDEGEIDALRDAARRTEAGIRGACARLRPGVRRLELFAAIRDEILAQGLDGVVFGPDCWAVGPQLALDWSNATTRNANPVLTPPCSVSLDVGARLRGYGADVGRTIFIGEPPPASVEALAAITQARAAGKAALAHGRLAHEADDLTRAAIAERGFQAGQWIPSGHGIGLDLHEPPILGEHDTTPLEAGNVVTFELAIWQHGVAGAFAEDTVVIREDGLEWLIENGDDPILIA